MSDERWLWLLGVRLCLTREWLWLLGVMLRLIGSGCCGRGCMEDPYILSYLAVFQIVGIALAFQSRKVEFPGLRDSAFIATIIYISSLVLVMLAVDTFILSSYLNTYGAIFAIGILILTSVFLIFTFVPKVLCGIVFVAVT